MERFSFGSEVAFVPGGDLLVGVTVAPLTPPISEESRIQVAIFRVSPGGRLLRHHATYPQILAVLEGSGEVSGGRCRGGDLGGAGGLLAQGGRA